MKILIAESQAVDRILLQNKLENLGYAVLSAGDGPKAWEIFQKNKIKMVIANHAIPEMDGLALCRKIRLSTKDDYVYLIVVAAKNKQKDINGILREEVDGYITRPFDFKELLASVKTGERLLNYEKKHKDMQNIMMVSRNKFKTMIDALQEEIIAIDKAYCIVSANRSFQQNMGFPFSELIGKPYFSNKNRLFSECCKERAASITRRIKEVFASGLPQNYFDIAKDEHGQTKHREFTLLPIADDASKVFQLVIIERDITDLMQKSEKIESLNKKLKQAIHEIQTKNEKLKNTLETLKTTQSQILQSEKMASVGQLAAGVAHEINNPVGFVSSNLRTLTDYQNDINKLIEHNRELISNLKGVAKDLPFFIGEKIEQIATLEKEIDIDFILDDTMKLVEECKDGIDRIKKIVLDLKDFAHPGEDKIYSSDINKGIESTLNVVWNELKYKTIVRISTLPTINGEKIVLRILDRNAAIMDIENLGLSDRNFETVSRFIELPQGIVLATGPTGSGKTSTLYSLLLQGATITKNFTTIEDPVEYFMGMAEQVHIREKIGLGFPIILRSLLRQDPNVIMIGEIRDFETAEIAFHAALTGHLVLSTLHTNSSISSIIRLKDIGIKPYVIAEALAGVVAQRLVRKICLQCKVDDDTPEKVLRDIKLDKNKLSFTPQKGAGCEHCNHTGYKGRIAVFEVLKIDEELKRTIYQDAAEKEIMTAARMAGMTTLMDDAINKVKTGVTTCEEVLRVIGSQNKLEIPCPKCGTSLEERFQFCPFCGAAINPCCAGCGKFLKLGWKNCPYCGRKENIPKA